MSAQVAGWSRSRMRVRLMNRRAAKSARMAMPKTTSMASSQGVRSAKDETTMNRIVAMSKMSRA